MKKRIRLVIISLLLLFSVQNTYAMEKKFTDVNKSDWYYSDINKAYKLGMVSGYEDGTFGGNNVIHLSEAYKIALDLLDVEYEIKAGSKWYEDIKNKAEGLNLYSGDKKITDEITRKDMAHIIFNILGGKEEELKVKFDDEVDKKVAYLVNRNIVSGYNENKKVYFKGNNKISRSEFFVIISRYLNGPKTIAKNKEYSEIIMDDVEFEDLTLTKDDFIFNENISSINQVIENLFYTVLRNGESYKVKYNSIRNPDNYHLMFFEAAQILNDKYPEYFSYYNRVNAEVVDNGVENFIVYLMPAKGERTDGLSVANRRDRSLDYLDTVIEELTRNNEISPHNSQYDNAKVIYNWVIDNVEYIDDEYSDKDPIDYDTYDVYGVSSRQEGVCQAYAGSLNYMLRKVGIEASGVAGNVQDSSTSHVWTKARIGGSDIYIDVTLGDSPNRDSYFDMDNSFYSQNYKEKTYKTFN